VNVLTEGGSFTGLLDFESVRLADPLFDAAWWNRAVSFSSASVLEAAWPAFLQGRASTRPTRNCPRGR
jgi:aminoglycoside phosphotransferase (APT) family kinase protein